MREIERGQQADAAAARHGVQRLRERLARVVLQRQERARHLLGGHPGVVNERDVRVIELRQRLRFGHHALDEITPAAVAREHQLEHDLAL